MKKRKHNLLWLKRKMIISKQNFTVLKLVGIVFFMLAASFASVPLYDIFCRVTGFAGTTQVSKENTSVITGETMVVRFAASVMSDMPWEFKPVDPKVTVRIGETNLVFFEAYNPTDDVITGTASYNVAPLELGAYFSKIDCFCFKEQTLQPHERVEMPVTFYVDPNILKDDDTKDIKSITLAYTFYLTSRAPVGKKAVDSNL